MPYKVCTNCGKVSYSAAESTNTKWLCPYCNTDITHVKSRTSPPPKEGQNAD